MRLLIVCALLAIVPCALAAGTAYNFTQMVDHFSTSGATYQQRYYLQDTYFKGPGSPIFCIMGGEGAIPPEVGLYYPFIYAVLAQQLNALVIEPEHRFYGASMPFGSSSLDPANMHLLNPQQALADASTLIVAIQKQYGCGPRGTPTYCPVITVGGSYPGFLSGMMRLRYPQVVDIGYAASAPMRFYSQQVDQGDYYKVITASAERAVAGCPAAVRNALSLVLDTPVQQVISELNICTPLPSYMSDDQIFYDELMMVIMVQFANMNMGNYPPTNATALAKVCQSFVSSEPWDALRFLFGYLSSDSLHTSPLSSRLAARLGGSRSPRPTLRPNGCFDFGSQTPSGPNGTVSCGDWSGCGGGNDGESWDYETCGFLVEPIGTNNVTDMFPAREWSYEWLTQHCQARFGITPQPRALADLWGFDHLAEMGASHIIFTNGLNDGWSAGGFPANLSDTLLVYNMPNGAHHSDLTHNMPSDSDTPDVKATRASIATVIAYWLSEIRAAAFDNLF